MKTRWKVIIGGWVVMAVTAVFSGSAVMADSLSQGNRYSQIIDEMILHCEGKAGLQESDSQNVRDDVALSLMKASFYRKNKALLMEDMASNFIEPKRHTVQHFLNERFFAIVRENRSHIAEAYSAPDTVALPKASGD